ncbi:uncharacterized protein DNG_01447 [Cephalotrichum gorgonifer]|uniref:Uncharacterized protein n=1 Tax=Cephalotrichum gorgonifer TaxID=2041049 RepID=A0AAE8SS84_9PEZI|nr:uncharacterized protein DNG_01447 [Cephalotrichum gorgonifer]
MPPSPTFESTPLQHCPSRDPIPYPVSYPTTWYALRSSPAFRACSNCYNSSILPARLSRLFYPVVEALAGPERFCNYNTPRVKALVAAYRASTIRSSHSSSGSVSASASASGPSPGPSPSPGSESAEAISALEAHAAHRVTVPDCRLGRPVAPDERFRWHRLRGGMDACHACFADFLSASNFAHQLPRDTVAQPPTQMALCDVGNAFARRMATESGDYDEFLAALATRRSAAPCAAGGDPRSKKWFRPRDARATGIVICEECFLDSAGGTQYETLFEGVRSSQVRGTGVLVCGFGMYPALAVNFGLMIEFQDPKLFINAVESVLVNPACDPEGIRPGSPYFTLPEVQNFAVCAPCVATLVAPIVVLDPHLVRGTSAPPAGTICALNAANPRVEQYIKKISEAAEKGEPEIFLSTAAYLSVSPPCPRSTPSDAPHRWTGNGEFSACEDCARDVVLQSPLAVFMTYREAKVPGSRKCDFYSPRVRGFWGQASRGTDVMGAMKDFSAIMRHREAVHRKMVKTRDDIEGGEVEPRDMEAMEERLRSLEALWREVE